MNTGRRHDQLIEEWSKALVALAEHETSNESAWDSEWDVGEVRADEALRVLHRIATAGGIELPNVPDWLQGGNATPLDNEAWSTFDQRQALAEGWCLMLCDGRGVIEIQRDDETNTFSRPALSPAGVQVRRGGPRVRRQARRRGLALSSAGPGDREGPDRLVQPSSPPPPGRHAAFQLAHALLKLRAEAQIPRV